MNSLSTTIDAGVLPWQIRPLVSALAGITTGVLELTTPEGYTLRFGDGSEPRAEVQLTSWNALHRIFRDGDIGLAKCYRDGLLRSSDLTALLRLAIRNEATIEKAIHGHPLLKLGARLRHLLRRNSRRGSAKNIQAHYDLGNGFYRLWLDPSMTYSSGRFVTGHDGQLTHAHEIKYQRMLDFAGADPGDSVLEIGCGWGGFAQHAATQGIRVHGVTLSHQQLAYARKRAAQTGFESLLSFELIDYRNLTGRYDHIVSIEMLEAVGERYWPTYFRKLNALLRNGGRAAIQTIVIGDSHFERYRKDTDFIQQYIFPGGMLISPGKLGELAGHNGLRIGRAEAFGRDYAETLRRWRRKFEQNLDQIVQQGFDERFIRIWRLYLSYCEAAFDERRIDVVQVELIKEGTP